MLSISLLKELNLWIDLGLLSNFGCLLFNDKFRLPWGSSGYPIEHAGAEPGLCFLLLVFPTLRATSAFGVLGGGDAERPVNWTPNLHWCKVMLVGNKSVIVFITMDGLSLLDKGICRLPMEITCGDSPAFLAPVWLKVVSRCTLKETVDRTNNLDWSRIVLILYE